MTAGDRAAADVFEALDDESCRCILETLTGEALTAKEIAERCDLPLSSTYRKIDRLVDASMVEESTRVRLHGKHVKEYRTAVDRVTVTIDDRGVRTAVRERPPGETEGQPAAVDGGRPRWATLPAVADGATEAAGPAGRDHTAASPGALQRLGEIDGIETVSLPGSDRVVVFAREAEGTGDEQSASD